MKHLGSTHLLREVRQVDIRQHGFRGLQLLGLRVGGVLLDQKRILLVAKLRLGVSESCLSCLQCGDAGLCATRSGQVA